VDSTEPAPPGMPTDPQPGARAPVVAADSTGAWRRLHESEARLRATLDSALDGVISIDASGRLIDFNPAAEAIFGWTKIEVLGRPMAELLIPPQHRGAHNVGLARFVQTRQTRILNQRVEITALRRDGSEFPVELTITSIRQNDADLFTAYIRDITERRLTEAQLRLAANVFTHSREGIFITDAQGAIMDVNDAFTRITGYTRAEALGRNPRLLSSGRQGTAFYAGMWRDLIDKGEWIGEIWNRRKDGEVYAETLTISAVRDAQGRTVQYVAQFSDITERKQIEDDVRQLAFHDALTRLPNRRLLQDRLAQAMAGSQRHAHYGALMFLDLDNFKPLNDAHGHGVGDLLLIEAAARLCSCVRASDTVARFGGDEFVVMLSSLHTDRGESITQACHVADKILHSLAQPYSLATQQIGLRERTVDHCCSASIGVALFGRHDGNQDDVLKWADAAMYRAKHDGRNVVRFHDPDAPPPAQQPQLP